MKSGPSSHSKGGAKTARSKGRDPEKPTKNESLEKAALEKTTPWKQGSRANEEAARSLARDSRRSLRGNEDEKPIRT